MSLKKSILWLLGVVAFTSLLAACFDDDELDEGSIDERSQLLALDSAIATKFADVSPYCPTTSDWSGWGQTPISTWDDDVEPLVRDILDTTGVHSTTYVGHDPSIGRAADLRPHSRSEGTMLANWLLGNAHLNGGPLGIQYIVWQGQIFNIARAGEGVRRMVDRGNFTQNHCDHVHVTFVPSGAVHFNPGEVTPWDGGAIGSDGCTAIERTNAAKFGCFCVDHKGAGGFCPGSGCTVLETTNAAKFGCGCVDHKGAGGFCPGSGCTALETANAAKFGCGCVDHKGAGGFCPGTGCTAKETNDCHAVGRGCSLHKCTL